MIIIKDMLITDIEEIDLLINEIQKNSYKEDYKIITDIYYSFLLQCYDADIRLQQMVSEQIGEDFISFVVLPIEETDDLDSFGFRLAHEENIKVKKRDELIFNDLCNICFGGIKPFYTRILEAFKE